MKSDNKISDSCGEDVTWARAVVSISKKDVRHLPVRDASLTWFTIEGVDKSPWWEVRNHNGKVSMDVVLPVITIRRSLTTSEDLG